MLTKLFKYDVCSGAKKYLLTGAVVVALMLASLLASIVNLSIINNLILTLSVLVSIGCFAVFISISVMDVYSKFCGRESYLTYVIPVGTKTIILSKVFALIIWGIFTIALISGFWLFYYFTIQEESIKQTIESIIATITDLPGFLDMFLLSLVFSSIFMLFQFILCAGIVNIPAIKNRNLGIPGAVISWIVIGQVVNIVIMLIWAAVIIIGGGKFNNEYINDPANMERIMKSLGVILSVGNTLFSIISFFVSSYIIEKHRTI